MSKDSFWFKHDSTAGRTIKMRKMQHKFGHEGKGLYWDVVELLRDQNGYTLESDESSLEFICELIGYKNIDIFMQWWVFCIEIGLFEEKKGKFTCPALSKNMKVWETKKANGSKGGRPKKKLNKTETKTEIKANEKHNIIEYNITNNKGGYGLPGVNLKA